MRLIGTILSESNARRFSAYLAEKGIDNRCEAAPDQCQIWVADEDRLAEATEELKQFCLHPSDPRYNTTAAVEGEEEAPPESKPQKKALLTTLLLAICLFVFVLNFFQELSGEKEAKPLSTPVQEALIFDLPTDPYWHGFYDIVSLKLKGENTSALEGPLFVQIKQGELWRLVSPAILHLSFLHILFNMVWLWILGKPIEERIGFFRLLILTLLIAALTNTAQYLMSGPLFLGFSGVVTGWAGFIWTREKVASWEGYPVHRSTILFLAIFIFAMLGLQMISFFLTLFTQISFPVTLANTAHIAGFVLGALFGRLPWFARRVR